MKFKVEDLHIIPKDHPLAKYVRAKQAHRMLLTVGIVSAGIVALCAPHRSFELFCITTATNLAWVWVEL